MATNPAYFDRYETLALDRTGTGVAGDGEENLQRSARALPPLSQRLSLP